ncbi:GDSL esterase/lipase At4g16230-like [Dioscorea cayenensis subsp. rotundata]|uniref:GDSL esterase/lipase At4g16230-like n=1 Tax=Dioscorea cayennensis subsp. rotundata TaxID=55577 RepID=A0AB40AWA3_DIOCR|nr:GDSL esterase/lipase At4g16230-like [Dioscorea cayenensis subsp. rotundata]
MAAPLQYSLLLLPFLCLFLALAFSSGEADPKVPAIFIFGDSSADVGNNKYLSGDQNNSNNFLPYGIDYPSENASNPTGRYSNGYNGADVLAQVMGFIESPPPFLSLEIDQITHRIKNITQAKNGINFASGGSTLLYYGSSDSNKSISMAEQMGYFRQFRTQLNETMTSQQIDQLFSKSLFLISIGGNDIGVYLAATAHGVEIELQKFISSFIVKYGDYLKDLYLLGGRKFGIVNVAPAGCIPVVKDLLNFTAGGCSNIVNAVSFACNYALKVLMNNLSSTLTGMKYSIGNSYAVFMKIIDNPGAFGFNDTKNPCCGSVENGCKPNSTFCPDRRRYVFWDGVHPTEATTQVFGHLVYNGSTEYASPINFKELVEDDN